MARFSGAVVFLAGWGALGLPILQAGLGDPERAWPSVVLVVAGGYGDKICNQGSGVVVAPGKIVTNFHVVEGKTGIRILPRGKQSQKEIRAYLLRLDTQRDLALLGTTADLPVIPCASVESIQIDSFVHAIGYPGGSHRMTSGRIRGITTRGNCLHVQTSAELNPGNSGGALVDESGCLVGINTRTVHYSGETLAENEAIHVREVMAFANYGLGGYLPDRNRNLYGSYRPSSLPRTAPPWSQNPGSLFPWANNYPWESPGPLPAAPPSPTGERANSGPLMGAVFEACNTMFSTLDHRGAKVVAMDPGGAADHAGLKLGDVVMMMDDMPVGPVRTFASTIRSQQPGSRVSLQLLREGLYKEVVVVLGNRWSGVAELPLESHPQELAVDDCPPQFDKGRLGLVVGPCPRYIDLPAGSQGLKIFSVVPGKTADRARLRRGDVILGLNGAPPGNSYNFILRLYGIRPGNQAVLKVLRGTKIEEIPVTVGWES